MIGKVRANASSLHRRTLELLREIYPQYTILQEQSLAVAVEGSPTVLFVDLFVKELNLVVECHGRQHYEFVPHFHGTRTAYFAACARDHAKQKTVRDNGMVYLAIPYNDEPKLTRARMLKLIGNAFLE